MADKYMVGDRVRLTVDLYYDDGSISLTPGMVGVVEAHFEDGMYQVRFVDGSPHDAVHWVKSDELEPVPALADALAKVAELCAALAKLIDLTEAIHATVQIERGTGDIDLDEFVALVPRYAEWKQYGHDYFSEWRKDTSNPRFSAMSLDYTAWIAAPSAPAQADSDEDGGQL